MVTSAANVVIMLIVLAYLLSAPYSWAIWLTVVAVGDMEASRLISKIVLPSGCRVPRG